jgi:thiamine-monophosphate kinase
MAARRRTPRTAKAVRTPLARSAEDLLIAKYFRPIARHPGALGLLDDVAKLTSGARTDLVLTTDALTSGVHFFPDDPPAAIARKALRVNLSDLAAKGAKPGGFLLSLALPREIGGDWVAAFARGLGADAKAYAIPLLGGDSVRTLGPITISIAAFGTLPRGTLVPRTGARPGDRVVVTGTIGDAALGLLLRRDPEASARWQLSRVQERHLVNRYLLPQPRNALAEALRKTAHATMDVSDGLAGDLAKLCAASRVGAEIAVAEVPLSAAARRAVTVEPSLIETVLTGGDDYEVLATVAPPKLAALRRAAAAARVPLAEIGVIKRGAGARFRGADGKVLRFKRLSFSHF